MAIGHNSPNFYNGGESPGLRARAAQVKAAYGEEEEAHRAAAEHGRATTGTVATRQQTKTAVRALERQIRYQRGQYPVRD